MCGGKKKKEKIEYNGWGLTKFKKYQMKKIKETFLKFCLSPCYTLISNFFFFFLGGKFYFNFFVLKMLFND